MLKKLTPVFIALLALSSSAFGREEAISLNGTKLTVNGIPDSWNQSKSQNENDKFKAKAFGSVNSIGLPYIEIALAEMPQSLQAEAFSEKKAQIVKQACASGFKANYLTKKILLSSGSDSAGIIKCESRFTAPDSPYVEIYFVKLISENRVGLISISMAQKGFTLMQLEAEMAKLIKDISFTAADGK